MPTTRVTGCPGLAVEYDSGQNPYFEVIVMGSLAELRKFNTGKALLAAIAGANPSTRGTGANGFAAGANVTIHPLATKVDFIHKGFQYATDTASKGQNEFNAFKNVELNEAFKTKDRIRTGGGNSHVSLNQAAAGNKSGTVAKVYFTNAIRQMQSGLASPPFVALAHELIHALHSLKGEKAAVTDDEEARTVGLGAFVDEPISENALRAEANIALRTAY